MGKPSQRNLVGRTAIRQHRLVIVSVHVGSPYRPIRAAPAPHDCRTTQGAIEQHFPARIFGRSSLSTISEEAASRIAQG